MGQTIKSSSVPTAPRKNPTNYGARFFFQEPDVNDQAE